MPCTFVYGSIMCGFQTQGGGIVPIVNAGIENT